MNANELRIGNYYKGASRGNVEIVTGSTIKAKEETNLNMAAIPLTEEWLMKLGFKELGDNSFEPWESSIYSLEYIRNHWHLLYKSNEVISTPFKYVHQLQNLFFALTGEELEFKS